MNLKPSELKTARSFLRQAALLVTGVRDLFRDHDSAIAARLADIGARLDAEEAHVERLLAASPNGGAQ
jgi:hypothetical protein